MDESTWMAISLIVLLAGCAWALYRSQYDYGFDSGRPNGECQKWTGRNSVEGYDTFCGKKTNRQFGDKWLCKVHNPNERDGDE